MLQRPPRVRAFAVGSISRRSPNVSVTTSDAIVVSDRKFGDEQSAEIVGCGVDGAEIDRGILEFPPTGGGHSAERNRCG